MEKSLNFIPHFQYEPCHTNELTGEFLDVMYSKMFFPLITRPTRITSHTATLIDNIFSNNMDNFA